MNAKLSIFIQTKFDTTVMHIFNVEADETLDWFKSNADELASKCMPGAQYTALNVEPGECIHVLDMGAKNDAFEAHNAAQALRLQIESNPQNAGYF